MQRCLEMGKHKKQLERNNDTLNHKLSIRKRKNNQRFLLTCIRKEAPMKKTVWITGTIIFTFMFVLFAVLTISSVSDKSTASVQSKGEIKTALMLQDAIDSFITGVYYTNNVLDANIPYDSYEAWKSDLEQAKSCFKKAQININDIWLIEEKGAFVGALQKFLLFRTAYAAKADDIIQVYDTAEKGQRIKALADFLGSDMRQALSALESADAQVADHWNNAGDIWAAREGAARIIRSGCKVTVLTAVGIGVGVPAVPFVIPSGIISIGGAATAVQLADDAAFIFKGADGFDNCTYTFTKTAGSAINTAKKSAKWLFIDNNGGTLKPFDTIKDIRDIMTDKEFIGLNIQGGTANMTSGDLNDAVSYAKALRDGETLLDEILALQNQLAQIDTGTVSIPETIDDSLSGTTAASQDFSSLQGTWVTLSFYMLDETTDPYGKDPSMLLQAYSNYHALVFTINSDGTVDWIDEEFDKQYTSKIEVREDGYYLQMRTDGAEWRRIALHENGYIYIDYYSATYGSSGGLVNEAYDGGYRYKIASSVE